MNVLEVIPAIDLFSGQVVRLTQGDPKKVTVFYKDPIQAALYWQKEGAKSLHIVDLDAALGFGENSKIIEKILQCVSIPTQIGGGIRSIDRFKKLLSLGSERLIVGTKAITDPTFIDLLIEKFGKKRLVIAVDYGNTGVLVKGWKESTGKPVMDIIQELIKKGIEYFLITSAVRDGTKRGPDYNILNQVCVLPKIKVIAAGGVFSLDDIYRLKKIGVYSTILGRSLYDHVFNLKDAIKIASD